MAAFDSGLHASGLEDLDASVASSTASTSCTDAPLRRRPSRPRLLVAHVVRVLCPDGAAAPHTWAWWLWLKLFSRRRNATLANVDVSPGSANDAGRQPCLQDANGVSCSTMATDGEDGVAFRGSDCESSSNPANSCERFSIASGEREADDEVDDADDENYYSADEAEGDGNAGMVDSVYERDWGSVRQTAPGVEEANDPRPSIEETPQPRAVAETRLPAAAGPYEEHVAGSYEERLVAEAHRPTRIEAEAALPAQEPREADRDFFAQWDKNGDGVIDREEFSEFLKAFQATAETTDGRIGLAQRRAPSPSRTSGFVAAGQLSPIAEAAISGFDAGLARRSPSFTREASPSAHTEPAAAADAAAAAAASPAADAATDALILGPAAAAAHVAAATGPSLEFHLEQVEFPGTHVDQANGSYKLELSEDDKEKYWSFQYGKVPGGKTSSLFRLPDSIREGLGVPENATGFQWAYPLTDLAELGTAGAGWLTPDTPTRRFCNYGGFIFTDDSQGLVAIRGVSTGGGFGLTFTQPQQWKDQFAETPSLKGRWTKMNMPELCKEWKRFAWIGPNEELVAPDGTAWKVPAPHGAFAFQPRRKGEASKFFPVLG